MTGPRPLLATTLAACCALSLVLAGGLVFTAGCSDPAPPTADGSLAPGPAAPDAPTGADDAPYGAPAPLRLPAFDLPTLDGAHLTRADIEGHPVVLHFWAPWSQPSLADLPLLDSLSAAYADGPLRVVGVLEVDGDLDEARALVDSLGLRYPVLVDERSRLAAAFDQVTMLPTTFLLDASGAVVHRRVGRFPTTTALEMQLRILLAAPSVEAEAGTQAPPQAHALSPARAQTLIREGAAVYDVRDAIEREAAALSGPATPAPLATLSEAQLPRDPMRPLLFVGDPSGARAQLAAEQALAWGHRRVYYTRGDLTPLVEAPTASAPLPDG